MAANIPAGIMACIAVAAGFGALAHAGVSPQIGHARAQTVAPAVPVKIQITGEGKERSYFNSIAWVKSARAIGGKSTPVKAGPGKAYATTDTLPANALALQMDNDGTWTAIVYAEGKPSFGGDFDIAKACQLQDPPPASLGNGTIYTGPCKVGWVLSRHMNFGEM